MWVPVAVRRVANCYTPFTFYLVGQWSCAVCSKRIDTLRCYRKIVSLGLCFMAVCSNCRNRCFVFVITVYSPLLCIINFWLGCAFCCWIEWKSLFLWTFLDDWQIYTTSSYVLAVDHGKSVLNGSPCTHTCSRNLCRTWGKANDGHNIGGEKSAGDDNRTDIWQGGGARVASYATAYSTHYSNSMFT